MTMTTYSLTDSWPELWDLADKLAEAADPGKDCLSVLCSLSEQGKWETQEGGIRTYRTPIKAEERNQRTETGVLPVETYIPGDNSIPTRIARRFGLGEYVVCKSAGYILQGDTIIDRPIHRTRGDDLEDQSIAPTTLSEILREDSDDGDVYWKSLEWRHIQAVVDESGGQVSRFELLSAIFRRLAEAMMDSETFIPYGEQFADSDFIDSF